MNQQRLLALQFALEGFNLREIGERLGITHQRVHQLLKGPEAIMEYMVARTKGRCQDCGIMARPIHIHAQDTRREMNNYAGKGRLWLLCMSCARRAHQKKRGTK